MSSRLQQRTDLFKQQLLTAQRQQLIGHLETIISGYEEQIDRQQKLLDVILQPEIKVRGAAVFAADVQQTSVVKEELLPEQQEWSRSQLQDLKDSFKQQLLTAPREDLIGHFETTISRYQREIDRQQKLLVVLLQPEIKLRRAVVPVDIQQLLVFKEEVLPEQQEWSSSLDQEDAEPPQIKEEQEELWITKLTFTPVPVKSEDEEKPEFSQLHQKQMETQADGEDCGEPARNSHPDTHLTPDTEDKTEDHFELEIQVSNDDENPTEAHLGLNSMNNDGYNSCEKLFSCSVCGKQFHRISNLRRHMRTHTGEKPFSCKVCGKSFALKSTLQNHLKCHTGEKPFSCSRCDKCFSRHAHLQSHMRTHTGEKPFSCSVCDERFSWCNQIKNHKCGGEPSQLHKIRTSLDQEDPPELPLIKEEQENVWTSQVGEQLQGLEEADIIKFTFTPVPVKSEDEDEEKSQSSQLQQRQTEQMESQADGEDCGGAEPASNSHPDTHLTPDTEDKTEDRFELEIQVSKDDKNTREVHLGLNCLNSDGYNSCEKLFSCSECGKQFHRTSNLKRHMRTHTGEKPFSCSVCGKIFALKSTLQNHFRSHTGEKPFSCSVCGKRFAQDAHLQGHFRCHTGEKPFSCSVCGKTFALKSTLQNHLRCHTGEKPFSCSVCDKCFSRHAHLQSHMRTHTGEKPFSCNVCYERFSWRHHIKNHKCSGELSQPHEVETSLDQEDLPEPPHIKEEQEEVWTSKEGEQLRGLEEADIIKFTFSPVPVKSEDEDEEKPQFSQFHQRQTEQMETEVDGEDCGGAEPARNSQPDTHVFISPM